MQRMLEKLIFDRFCGVLFLFKKRYLRSCVKLYALTKIFVKLTVKFCLK